MPVFLSLAMLQKLTRTGHNLSSGIIAETTLGEIHGERGPWNKTSAGIMGQLQRRNSTGSAPRLIRHVTASSDLSPNHHTSSRASSPSRAFYVPSQTTSQPCQVPSSARFIPSCSGSPAPSQRLPSRTATPVRQLSSPAQFSATRGNASAARESRRRSIPIVRVPNHTRAVVAAKVHNSPRRHRKSNGKSGRSRHLAATNRARHLAGQRTVNYGGALSDGDGEGFLRSIDSIPAHSGSRSAYDFVQANKRNIQNPQGDIFEKEVSEEDETESETVADKPWIPTGTYAVMLITLWTAVVRLTDSVEENGPATCSEGEETRLWICAASFSLMQGLAEALWQRKNLLKVLFSMSCLFGYFIILHIQPLSCRIGEDKVTELSKWQSAMNFFVSTLLGINIYRHISESMHKRKDKNERQARAKEQEDAYDEFEGLPEGVL